MVKDFFAKRRIRKLSVFFCAFALAVVITAVGTSANNYDTDDAMGEGIMGNPARSVGARPFSLPMDFWYNNWGYYQDPTEDAHMGYEHIVSEAAASDSIQDNEIPAPPKEEINQKTDKKPEGKFTYHSDIPLSEELQLYTYEQCQLNGLDYEIVLALMWRESRFQADAVNHNSNGTMDSGIMQINDVNRQWIEEELGITDLMDPMNNIRSGTVLLGRLTNKYGEHYALMAYQYGETGMERKISQGVTTSKQIQALYTRRDYYEKLYS